MEEFRIGAREFKVRKLDAFFQYHIARRVAPILADLAPVVKDLTAFSNGQFDALPESEKLDGAMKFAAPVMLGLSKLSDADSEYVLHGLLSAVEVKNGPAWVKISNGKVLLMQDMELPMLLQIAGRAFGYNMSGFFAGLPSTSPRRE